MGIEPDGARAGPSTALAFERLSRFDPADSLATQQVDEMVAAWHRGERPLAEEFLARYPELGDEAAIRLVYEEFCLRQEAGLEVDTSEIARRFPQWHAELQVLLDCHRMMEPAPALAALPSVGEDFAGFRLRAELGRGVLGRVFLATQPDLSDRPVVLKVTPAGRAEHLSLAQLQHMNIVPLYSAQVLHDRHLEVLCMPFLGGASLAQVLEAQRAVEPAQRTGRQLTDALDHIHARLPIAPPAEGPFRQYLARSPYVEAVCWLVACLADGLQYAHERNLVHLDIKPSNVLIAGDGQPMLLDFHVARGPLGRGEPAPAWAGGTPEYMPPEQRGALDAVLDGRPISQPVDGRADLYSLGLLLYEALGGQGPRMRSSTISPPLLRGCNPRVSLGLSDIIHKCLEPDPSDRYPNAAALAADLRRHLNDLPLAGVANRSLAERWRKWRKRRPSALPRSLITLGSALTLAAAAGLLWVAYHQRVQRLETLLADGRESLEHGQYAEATSRLARGLALAEHLPAVDSQHQALEAALVQAQHGERAAELHHIVELFRLRYGLEPPPAEETLAFIARGRALWQYRRSLVRPAEGAKETDVDRAFRDDLLDFALVWADLRVRSAQPAEVSAARVEARHVLNEADDVFGPSPALERDLLIYEGDTGPLSAHTFAPRSAWEHYELGRSYLRSDQVVLAAEQFAHGLDLRPQDFWLNFYEGLCAYRLGHFEDAVNAFRVCVALNPEAAECAFNRALAHAALGETGPALRDYTRALALNPKLAEAALNRGILHYQEGRLSEARADLRQALATVSSKAGRATVTYNLALVDLARGDRPAARSSLEVSASLGHQEARRLLDHLGSEP